MNQKTISILRTLVGLLAVVGLMVSCGSTVSPQPTPSLAPTQIPQSTAPVSIQPTPKVTEAMVSVLPTPDPNWAIVAGTLVGSNSGEPVSSVTVFLERTPQEHSAPRVLYGPPNDQPRTTTNDTGQFVITQVPDGEYVIVVYSPPLDLDIVTDPSSEQPLFVSAQAGRVVEVGTVTAPTY